MSNPTILIVEDEAIISKDIANKLRRLGYAVAGETDTGEKAIEIARQLRPSLVLMDIRLAGAMDGVIAADTIRKECRLPVVFMTAHSDNATVQRAGQVQAFGYIMKPFDDRELHVQIEMALSKHAAELLLIESREQLREVLENSRDALYKHNHQANTFDYLSPVFSRISGYTPDEIKSFRSENYMDSVHPDDLCEFERLIAASASVTAGMTFQAEYRFKHKDGRYRWFHQQFSIIRNAAGQPLASIGSISDISERKQIADSFRQSEERFRLVFENSLDGILLTSPDGGIYAANPAACRILGWTEQEICEGGRDIVVDVTDSRLPQALKERTLTGRFRGELNFRRKDGTAFPVEASSSTFLLINGEQRAYITFRDITRRKQAAAEKAKLENMNRQLQKAESLNRMAGAVAHHFNNHLQVVVGSLEMAIEDLPKESETQETLSEGLKAARKASEVSGLMLTCRGQVPGKHEPIDLSEACRQSLALLQAGIPKGVSIKAAFPASSPVVITNTSQVHLVLNNLITNAREAAEEGRGIIGLTVKTVSLSDIPETKRFPIDWQPMDAAYACLEIMDAGCGVQEKDIEKIFDPFFSTKFTGRGLGLSVVLGIVKAHSGGMTVESEPGRGSVFRVFLPISTEEIRLQQDKTAPSPKIEECGTVLLVEDEAQVRFMAKKMLARLGYRTLEAKDGVDAVEIFRQHPGEIRCVLSDLTMPRMNGWETLAALRRISPDIPVILSSGYDEAQVMADEHPELPNAFLGKPYRLKDLSETISSVMANDEKKN